MKCLRFFLLFFGAACFFPSLCRRHFDSSVPSRRAAPLCRYLTFHVRGALSTTSLLLARVNLQQRAQKACSEALPLRRVYFLGDGSATKLTFQPMQPSAALISLVKNTFLLDIDTRQIPCNPFRPANENGCLADLL